MLPQNAAVQTVEANRADEAKHGGGKDEDGQDVANNVDAILHWVRKELPADVKARQVRRLRLRVVPAQARVAFPIGGTSTSDSK